MLTNETIEPHVFCDASEQAMGREMVAVTTNMSKTRVIEIEEDFVVIS